MKMVRISPRKQPSALIRFTGDLVATAESTEDTGRWTELALYQTRGGAYVCHQIGRSRREGERDQFSGKVCESVDEVVEFFGHRWLAKELYAAAGITDAIEIE